MKSRFTVYFLLLALPVLAFCALGVYFLADKAPKLINAEKSAITREYREIAENLVTNAVAATWIGERAKGWRQISKIDRKFPWGVSDLSDGKVLVWIEREDRSVIGCEQNRISDYTALWVYGGFGLALLLVVVFAGIGILLLWRYNTEREAFAAAIIHDLRNPLVAIRGLAKSDPDYVSSLADSMLCIVKNAQDFLKTGRDSDCECKTFDLVEVIRESYRVFEPAFRDEESGPVAFDLPDSLPVVADVTLVRQILWNLFSNAVKYAAPCGPVRVSLRKDGNKAVVAFSDCGPGMSSRQLRRAFDRFYRANSLRRCGKGGFGIGLCISRAAARRMGGDLTVRQNIPKGCVFTLTLKSAIPLSTST